ncbi:MAG: hypothetical protein OEO83_00700 [Alphaproteobacteria bacterium]|nr:hypothetical protein [Alphaproteobacteria bacterium]
MQLNWPEIAGQARRKVLDYRYSIAAGLGVVTIGGVVWAASAPEYSPTYYVVKWNSTGLCTVVDDRPDDRRTFKTMWFTTLKSVASRKAKELHENGRCARLDEGRKIRPFG